MIEIGIIIVGALVALKIFVTPHAAARGREYGISDKELRSALGKLPDGSYGRETWVPVRKYDQRQHFRRDGECRDSSCDSDVAVVKNGAVVTIRPTRKEQYKTARDRGVRIIE